jgi:hypothetical protein
MTLPDTLGSLLKRAVAMLPTGACAAAMNVFRPRFVAGLTCITSAQ